METPKLLYEKSEGLKKPAAKRVISQSVPEETFANASISVEGYQKPMPEVEVTRIFVISGGTKREPDYFKLLRKETSLKRIMVVVRSKKGQGLLPLQMSAMASKFYSEQVFETEEGNTYKLFANDSVYLLSDVDEFGKDLCQLVKSAPSQQVWIVSNPCFEIWLFYHYYSHPLPELKDGLDIELSKRSQWMKQQLHQLRQVNSSKALLDMPTAIKNSKANYKLTTDGLPDVFSTQMHELAVVLLNAITKDGFESMIKQQQDTAKYYRNNQKSPQVLYDE